MGSYKSIKIPFGDELVNTRSFSDEKREYLFDFMAYEKVHKYTEVIEVKLGEKFEFIEIPENITLLFKGNKYSLTFEKIDGKKIVINRIYELNRKQIIPEEYVDFKKIMVAVNEAENTHLLFK